MFFLVGCFFNNKQQQQANVNGLEGQGAIIEHEKEGILPIACGSSPCPTKGFKPERTAECVFSRNPPEKGIWPIFPIGTYPPLGHRHSLKYP